MSVLWRIAALRAMTNLPVTLTISAFSIAGNIYIGYNKKQIWKFAHLQNFVSALYFVFTKQYGFLVENAFYAGVFINNQRQWNKEEQ